MTAREEAEQLAQKLQHSALWSIVCGCDQKSQDEGVLCDYCVAHLTKLLADALHRTAQRQRDQDIAIIQRNIHRMKSGQLIVGVKAELYAEQLRNAPLVTESSP